MLTKTIPQIQMFSNQIHMVKMKIEIIEVLYTQSLPLNDSNLDLGTLPIGRKKWWRLQLSISLDGGRQKLWKPNPYGVFIGFLSGLKRLESTWDWVT